MLVSCTQNVEAGTEVYRLSSGPNIPIIGLGAHGVRIDIHIDSKIIT